MSRRAIISVLTFASFILIAMIVILLAQGYRFNSQTGQLEGTGIMVLESEPTGAAITIDGKSKGVSNTSVSNLSPGTYEVTYTRDGYFPWTKQVVVEKNKVVTTTALMIPINPSLAPISSTPADRTTLSPDGQRLAYVVPTGTSSGVWMLDLSAQPFNLARKPILLTQDTEAIKYSTGQLTWSPSSKELLISLDQSGISGSYLVSADNPNNLTAVNPTEIEQRWAEEETKLNQQLGGNMTDQAKQLIKDHADTLVWSPDNLKFMYQTEEDGKTATYVYNKESKQLTKAFMADKDKLAVIRWYADANHLLLLEKDKAEAKTGVVSLMGMDGTNKQQIYNGTLYGDALYTYLSGSKLVILTSFNQQEPAYYLYSINLR